MRNGHAIAQCIGFSYGFVSGERPVGVVFLTKFNHLPTLLA
jgi:hypothetical protein